MSDATIVYLVLAGVVILFISQRVPVEIVAIGSALALYFTDVLTLEQSFAGFGDPTVIFIASLFVVSEALETTGVTAWATQQLIHRAGASAPRLLVFTMLLVAIMSALITPNGAVATLVPVVVVLAIRLGRSPSEMLLPLSYASFSGALLVLTGSPVNVLIADASHEAGGGGFAFLEFAIVGIPLLLGTIVVTVLLGPRLLPRRQPRTMPVDFSEHARTLLAQYAVDEPLFRLQLQPNSPLVGLTRDGLDLTEYEGLTAVSAQEEGGRGPVTREALAPGDILVIRGNATAMKRLAAEKDLRVVRSVSPTEGDVYTRESGVPKWSSLLAPQPLENRSSPA